MIMKNRQTESGEITKVTMRIISLVVWVLLPGMFLPSCKENPASAISDTESLLQTVGRGNLLLNPILLNR